MKERLLLLYKLHKIDRELLELYSLRGDIPEQIEELTAQENKLKDDSVSMQAQLIEINGIEEKVQADNDRLLEKIEKNDEILRSGAVKSNKEYDALAREIEDAKNKIDENERMIKEDYSGKKQDLMFQLGGLKVQVSEVQEELELKTNELKELTKQTEEEESELKAEREELLRKINSEDMETYNRINDSRYGEAMALVRKGSCLGCYSSIPPQRVIEIKMANQVFHCESCGRILIAEELLPRT
ncbi:MAG TPA: C4-type zinc ribbon domain-containing protein [Ignavibacteria bacterium]|nr:C4-type zinc ribbon domain-containing protein [Ignavibacteria bacterium]